MKVFLQKGYTLVEIIVVITLIGIIAAMTYVGFRHYQLNVEVRMAAQEIKNTLFEAKNRTIASRGASRWGVHFDSGQYVIYKVDLTVNPDDGYDVSGIDNEAHALSKDVELCEINLEKIGGTAVSGVYYQYLEGINNKISGTVKVCLKKDNSRAETIAIERFGSAETVLPGNSSDNSRHLHFEITENITNTDILRLNFVGSGITRDITFQNYYEEELEWSDIIVVGGKEQRLRIHTHFIDSSSAVLCIHRDERYNSKPLEISLRDLNGDGNVSDSIVIVSYDSNNIATKGSDSRIEMYVQ